MNNVNVFDVSIKLYILYKNDYILIIFKDHNNFEIRIVKSQKLIEKVF